MNGRAGWNLDAVGAAFARAASDPTQWAAAMDAAAAETGSAGAVLLPLAGRLPSLPYSPVLTPLMEDYFQSGWSTRDLRTKGLHLLHSRGVFGDLDVYTPDEINRAAYYQDFLGRHGLRWFSGVTISCSDEIWCMAIQRSIAQGPFSQREQMHLARLSGSLGSAAALARALGFAQAEAALEALEAAGTAVVLIDRSGDVLRVNAAAERLVGRGLRIVNRRLVSESRDATAALDRALHRLLWAQSAALTPPVTLPRPVQRPVLAYPLRLPALEVNPLAPAKAAVVLRDLEDLPRPPEAHLRATFGFTRGEARLASRLATGASLETIADELGVKIATTRVVLKAVFTKMETHRQAEAVAVLSRVLGGE
jgi:DNA-binding CsgD family transcriptional regulator/PAS domain-containing protein